MRLLVWIFLIGCAAAPGAQAQVVESEPKPPAVQPATQTAPAAGVTDHYLIGPGDKLQVFVWNHPELTITLPVRPDGQISTPLVENMQAAGRTSSDLARDLEGKLSEYVRSPTVNVIVTEPLSTFSQVKIVGQVLKPQAIPFRQGITVMDVVLASGGLNEFAAGNRAKVIRTRDGKSTELRVRVSDLINKGDMKQNLALQPGDVLVIPQTLF